MRPFFTYRRSPLQFALATLLLAFVLNSLGHVAHQHDATTSSVSDVACGYCASFGGLADAQVHTYQRPTQFDVLLSPPFRIPPPRGVAIRTAARPRAPPSQA